MIRLLERDGWVLVVTKGSHRQFKHPTKPGRVTVSGHVGDDMPKGTLASVKRQAGLRGDRSWERFGIWCESTKTRTATGGLRYRIYRGAWRLARRSIRPSAVSRQRSSCISVACGPMGFGLRDPVSVL